MLLAALDALPDGALVPVGWLRARLRTPEPVEPVADCSCADVARMLDRRPGTIRGWCARGEMPGAYQLNGREWRIPRPSVRAYLDRQAAGGHNADNAGPVDLGTWRRHA